jgi:hypothetical protein
MSQRLIENGLRRVREKPKNEIESKHKLVLGAALQMVLVTDNDPVG